MWPDCKNDRTGLALLHGARDHHDEDDRRLILADWLDDQGEDLVAHLLRQSLPLDRWVVFPGVVRERWHPWNGCWRGWPGIQPRGLSLRADCFPHSPWLCVIDLSFQPPQLWQALEVQALRKRAVYLLAGDALSRGPSIY